MSAEIITKRIEILAALFKVGVKYTAYHEDDSITVEYNGKYFNIKEVELNQDGSIKKKRQ